MKIILESHTKQDRINYENKEVCDICWNKIYPNYRFIFHSNETDKEGYPLIEGEIISCEECYNEAEGMFEWVKK